MTVSTCLLNFGASDVVQDCLAGQVGVGTSDGDAVGSVGSVRALVVEAVIFAVFAI